MADDDLGSEIPDMYHARPRPEDSRPRAIVSHTNDYDASMVPNFSTELGLEACDISDDVENDDAQSIEICRVHALVYSYADMLGIEALKVVASARYQKILRTLWHLAEAADVLKVMYESTPDTDESLRRPVTRSCIIAHLDETLHPDVVEVVKQMESSAWNVAVPLLAETMLAEKERMDTAVRNARKQEQDIAERKRFDIADLVVRRINGSRHCAGGCGNRLTGHTVWRLRHDETVDGYCPNCMRTGRH
jgi:hypothetical protein